jgi:hypothetical protein
MRMKIWKHLEAEILQRVRAPDPIPRMTIRQMEDNYSDLTLHLRDLVDFRVTIGARAKIDGRMDAARDRIVRLLAGEMFGDVRGEVRRLQEWAYLEGYDEKLLRKIERIERLLEGEDVE